VLAALAAVYRESHRIPGALVLAGSVFAVIAAGMLLLNQLLVNFGDLSNYEDAKKEFSQSENVAGLRSPALIAFLSFCSKVSKISTAINFSSDPLGKRVGSWTN
jgi:hypothetical protein